MKVKYIKTNGTIAEVEPKDGKRFSLAELQGYVGGLIDIVEMPDGSSFILNDEGKLDEEPKYNHIASMMWQKAWPLELYPHNNDGTICGDVLYFTADQRPCPACGEYFEASKGALSRKSNIPICSECGVEEALYDARKAGYIK